MIKAIVTHTIEPVDIEFALDEITAQLYEKGPLLSHTVGLLFCNFEFLQSGLVRELCGRLPFDIAGCTSQALAVQGAGEEFMLTLMVITSDDVEFYAGFSEPLSAGNEAALEKLYLDLLSRGSAAAGADASADASAEREPALMFVFPPFLTEVTGNTVVSVLDRVSGGIPIFGSAAIDITTDLRSPMTIFNGSHSPDRVPLVLLRGNVQPKFFSCSLPGEVRFSQNVFITKAKGNRIIEIDNRPAVEFVGKLGLINQGVAEVLYAFPIVVDYHDGTEPRIFTVSKIDTDGSLVSEQDIPVGGTVNLGTISGELVIESTRHLLDQIMKTPPQNGLILVSCISRILTLRDSLEEIEIVQRQFRDLPMPFVFFSSGGEVCPLYRSPQDKPVNAFHQFTIIACII